MMKLQCSMPLTGDESVEAALAASPATAAVFAIYFDAVPGNSAPPYLARTSHLHRRLARLLGKPRPGSRLLNLRRQARRVEYSPVGSALEAFWLLYLLNKTHYPQSYRQRLRLKSPALLKLNIGNPYPRLYPTRRLARDSAEYYGPFASRAAAERFASEFLDFFKIRRCVEDLRPDPSHPGCIYSQMKMCLAPCFQGCTDEEYRGEVSRVVASLDGSGRPLVRGLEEERAQASDSLDFERAAKVHGKIEKVSDVLRQKPDLARNVKQLDAVLVTPGAEVKTVVFFRVAGGELRGPGTLSLDENVPTPVSLDEQIRDVLEPLGSERDAPRPLPPWEHLSLLARWYYSSFRSGEIIMLEPPAPGAQKRTLPTRALIRACRKVLAQENT